MPGCQSADFVLCTRRQKEQRHQFERWILQVSRTYYVHSTRRQYEQRCLKRLGRLIEERWYNMSMKSKYRIITLFGACAYSQKTAFWELIENAGAPCTCIFNSTYITVNFRASIQVEAHAPKSAIIRHGPSYRGSSDRQNLSLINTEECTI